MPNSNRLARYFAALSAILIAPFTYATIALYLQVTGGDTDGVLKPALMLGLPRGSQHLFVVSMVFDALGSYALVLFVGGYLWSRLRQTSNGLDEIAILALGIFATLGIAGAAFFASTLPALSRVHADAATRSAAEVAWLALASGVEHGLWLFEYLPFAIWCFLTAPRLRAAGARHGWLLMIIGAAWALYFVGGVLELAGSVPSNLYRSDRSAGPFRPRGYAAVGVAQRLRTVAP